MCHKSKAPAMTFTLLNLETKEPLANPRGETRTYKNGKAAARAAAFVSAKTGVKVQPRKLAKADDSWKDRESARMGAEYALAPYSLRIAAIDAGHGNHFVHLSAKQPGRLAYTQSPEKGMADIQSIMSLDAYLAKYLPDLDSGTIMEIREDFARLTAPEAQFKLATTPKDIEQVYTNFAENCEQVSSSCMRYQRRSFGASLPVHPVQVYGAGDLAIAYLTNSEGETTHRALCWPDRKVYSRMYGDDSSLHDALKAAGYVKCRHYYARDGHGSLEGARLLVIRNDNDSIVAPYIDGALGMNLTCNKAKLSLSYDYACNNTDGLACDEEEEEEREPEYTCEHCGDEVSEDDTFLIYTSRLGAESWCEHCRESYSFYCEGYERDYSSRVVDSVEVEGLGTCSEYYADNHCEQCEHSERWHRVDDDALAEVVINDEGETEKWDEASRLENAWLGVDAKWRMNGVNPDNIAEKYIERSPDQMSLAIAAE